MSGWKFFIKFPAELFWRFWGFGYVCNLAIGDKCWLLDSEGYKPILGFVLTITESKYIRTDFIQIIARKLFRFAAFYFHFRKHQETKESFLLGFYRDVDVFFICKQRVALAKLDHYQHRSWLWSQRYPLNRLHRIQNIYKYLLLLMSYRHENLKVLSTLSFSLDTGKEIYKTISTLFRAERWLEDRKISPFGISFDLTANSLSYYCRTDV